MNLPEARPAAPGSVRPDAWTGLRRHTTARIALGRAGGSLPTGQLLAFAVDHALARDAVHAPFDRDGLADRLEPLGLGTLRLDSRAGDRRTYLLRPDLGRRLADDALARVQASAGDWDVALVVGDGLSATAAHAQAEPLLAALVPQLRELGLRLAPVAVVRLARVAVADEVGAGLRARLALMLLGERPGLGCADSLGAYLTHAPRPGCRDSERTCVSNIRAAGLPVADAAATLAWFCREALRRGLTGTALKDERRLIG